MTGSSSDEPYRDALVGQHPPVSLEEAIAEVDGWAEGFGPFRLYQIARTLREETIRLQGLLDAMARGAREEAAEYKAEADALYLENADLRYRLGRTGAPLDKADGYRSAPVTLEHALGMMDAWREDVECWGLHQMCRALRGAYEAQTMENEIKSDVIHEIREIAKDATGGNCAFIVEAARKAIAPLWEWHSDTGRAELEESVALALDRFAAARVEAERERCAALARKNHGPDPAGIWNARTVKAIETGERP